MKSTSILFLVLMSVGLSACSNSSSGDGERARSFTGSLSQRMAEIYGPEDDRNFSDCDLDQKAARIELAQALDQRRDQIETLRAQMRNDNAKAETISYKIGRLQVSKVKEPKTGIDQWAQDVYSWNDIVSLYQRIKNQPVDENWVYLNIDVRGVVVDDMDRIVEWANYSIQRLDKPMLEQIYQIVSLCVEQKCSELKLAPEQIELLKSRDFYPFHLRKLSEAKNPEEYQVAVAKLQKSLKYDVPSFLFSRRSHEVDPATKTIFVQINQDVVQDQKAEFEELTSNVWSKFGLKVVIRWLQQATVFDLFQIKLIEDGERAFVSAQDKSINLPPHTRAATISHEFGHVLGLKDEYHTSWAPSECAYHNDFNDGNIMATGASTGQILREHIEKIMKAYFP